MIDNQNNHDNRSNADSLPQNQQQNHPEAVLRDGNIKASIWRNEGDSGMFHSTTLARTYEDKDGNLRDTHSFAGTDLLKVSELARGAYARTNELRSAAFKEQRRAQEASSRTQRNDRNNSR